MKAFLKEYGSRPDVGSYTFKFGKYKGKSYQEVYDSDKSYCAFLYQKLDRDKNKVLLDYIEKRVKEEYITK
jgi:hypothetical protein